MFAAIKGIIMGNASSGNNKKGQEVVEEKSSSSRSQQPPSPPPQKTIEELLPSQTLDIYTEAAEATVWSIGVFALADLRSLALPAKLINKNDNSTGNSNISFEDANEILELPIEETKFGELNVRHADLLKRKKSGDYEKLIPSYLDKHDRPRSLTIYYVGDDKSDSECVYFIGYDSYRKVITLVFRGSITPRDWIEDTKAIIDEIPNPLKLNSKMMSSGNAINNNSSSSSSSRENNSNNKKDQQEEDELDQLPDTVGIHWGFRNYLHGNSLKPIESQLKALPKHLRKLGSSLGLDDDDDDDMSSKSNSSNIDDVNEGDDGKDENAEKKDIKDDDSKTSSNDGNSNSSSSRNNNNNNNNERDEDGKDQSENDENNSDNNNDDDDKSKASSSRKRRKKTKIQIILEQLHKMKLKYPNDPIFITGHSLGGALSLIASLAVASDPTLCTIPSIESSQQPLKPGFTPVTVVAVANPKVGNKAFNDVMDYLERSHRLRCLTIHNEHDIVPMMTSPNLTSKSDPNHPEREFCKYHPGFRLLLKEDKFQIDRHGNGTAVGDCSDSNVGSSVCSRGPSADDDDDDDNDDDKNDENSKDENSTGDNGDDDQGVEVNKSPPSSLSSSSPPPPTRRRSSVQWIDNVWNTFEKGHAQKNDKNSKDDGNNSENSDNNDDDQGVDVNKLDGTQSPPSSVSSPPPTRRRRSSVRWINKAVDVWNTIEKGHAQLSDIVTKNVSRNQHNYRLYLERILSFEEKGLNELYLNSYYSELVVEDGNEYVKV